MPLNNKSPGKTTNRKQKTDSAPGSIPEIQPQSNSSTNHSGTTSKGITSIANRTAAPLMDLSGVAHGLNFPSFEPNSYFATDLFTDSSPLPRTTKAAADAMVQSIEEKRQTLRVAMANLGLNQDVVKTGTEYRKLQGLAIDYAKVGMANGTKYMQYMTAGVDQMVAHVKHDQAVERLNQEEHVLSGMRGVTPLIPVEWTAKRELKLSKIQDLKTMVLGANVKMTEQIGTLGASFESDLQSLG